MCGLTIAEYSVIIVSLVWNIIVLHVVQKLINFYSILYNLFYQNRGMYLNLSLIYDQSHSFYIIVKRWTNYFV